jgi:hypothetical protein
MIIAECKFGVTIVIDVSYEYHCANNLHNVDKLYRFMLYLN